MQLKRWESPRRKGRNDKGKGGSARQRQLKKQQQMLRKRLKEGHQPEKDNQPHNLKQPDKSKKTRQGEENLIFPLFFSLYLPEMKTTYFVSVRYIGLGKSWSNRTTVHKCLYFKSTIQELSKGAPLKFWQQTRLRKRPIHAMHGNFE